MIAKTQLQRKTEEIKQALLKNGIEPNSFEVSKKIHEFFDTKTMGLPYYSPKEQTPYEVSSKEDYNHNFETLNEDLKISYEVNTALNNKATSMQEYYDTEENNIRNRLSNIALQIDNIQDFIKENNGGVEQHIETFNDYYGIDFYGNTKRNIPYTTAFVDLMQKRLYTDKSNHKVNKVPLKNAKISYKREEVFASFETSGELKDLLSDTLDQAFIFHGKTTSQSSITMELIVDIGNVIDMNSVMFSFSSIRDLHCVLSLSEDGKNYIQVYENNARDFIEWNFKTKRAKYIKIVCTKYEPDGENDSLYDYYFIFKNISIANEEFESKSTFVSKPIEFEEFKSSIVFHATDMIFNGTNISYFIGLDNGTDKVGWDSIKNHEAYSLNMFDSHTKIINASSSEIGNEDGKVYRLFKIPDGINRNSIKVIPGYHMWNVIKYNPTIDNWVPNIKDLDLTEYAEKCTKTQLFMDCENYSGFTIEADKLYVFNQLVKLEENKSLQDIFISIIDPIELKNVESAIRIFVNGYEINPVNNKFSFSLKKGISKIQFVLYTPMGGKLYHNFNAKQMTDNVFAFGNMKYLNDGAIEKQKEEYKYYTIKNGYICTNSNPEDIIKSDLDDMAYYIAYNAVKNDLKQYFKDDKLKIRIMAVLTSMTDDLSPSLINYRIMGK